MDLGVCVLPSVAKTLSCSLATERDDEFILIVGIQACTGVQVCKNK